MSEIGVHTPLDLVEQGRALHRAGKLEDAERLYARALAADEDCAEAHQLMAVIAGQRGRFDEAIRGFRRAIALEGPTHDRLFNLAEAYRAAGQLQPALEAYNQALTLDAGDLDAYRRCAAMAEEAAERARASGDSDSADRLRKLAAHYLLGLGHACLRADNQAAGEQAYRKASALDPERAEIYNCLGAIALNAHRPVEAEALQRRALALEPQSPLYLDNLGLALRSQLRIDEASDLFRRAIEIDPSYTEARRNLGERMLQWLLFRAQPDPQTVVSMHREWGRTAVAHARQEPGAAPILANSRDPERPLRVGYVGIQAASRLVRAFLEPLLARQGAGAIETVIYASEGTAEGLKRLRALAGKWRQAPSISRAKELAETIRNDGIDILIDPSGHSAGNRLDVFARKPAPVTVTWLGYPGTTGLPTMDYRITDEVVDPAGVETLYTERLIRLRGGSVVYRPPEQAPDVAPLAARTAGEVTFGNVDDPRKISPETVQTWSAILRALPAARLVLMAREFVDSGFAAQMHAAFEGAGIARGRVELRPVPADRAADLAQYGEIDIGLDTFPYNGSLATIGESLWMGVPVVSLSGDRPWARTSASVLAQVGLERLDSVTAEEYAETAVELAGDLDRLRNLRSGMRERMRVSPLMDESGFAHRFEAALREMWRRWCRPSA